MWKEKIELVIDQVKYCLVFFHTLFSMNLVFLRIMGLLAFIMAAEYVQWSFFIAFSIPWKKYWSIMCNYFIIIIECKGSCKSDTVGNTISKFSLNKITEESFSMPIKYPLFYKSTRVAIHIYPLCLRYFKPLLFGEVHPLG